MYWYLVHTKPRQEKCALLNLEQQGYEAYLPLLPVEKLRQGAFAVEQSPLFPRYLFVRLDTTSQGKSWAPIRSTRGVSRLVSFGLEPAKVDSRLVDAIRERDQGAATCLVPMCGEGETVRVVDGPFAGLDAIYQMKNGESRVMVLIELMSKPVKMSIPANAIAKVAA